MHFIRSTLRTTALIAAIEAALLTGLLGWANRPLSPTGWVELGLVLVWIAVLTNGFAAAALALLWSIARRPRGWVPFLVFGLVAFHVVWGLLNRLTLAQTWMRPPGFLTVDGIVQLVGIGIVGALLLGAGLWWPSRRRAAAGLAGVSLMIVGGLLTWAMHDERLERTYALSEVRQAAAGKAAPVAADGLPRPVILLGIDGMGWAVAKPLLEAGLLPNFAALITSGTIGVLDNGDDSYSPVIWNTIYTGQLAGAHGIHGFRNLRLPRSGDRISDLLMMRPSLHTFHGLRHLLERVPNPGLWSLGPVGSVDRREKTVWEVGAENGARVVAVGPITSLPLPPTDATMIVYKEPFAPSAATPPRVARAWEARRPGDGASFAELVKREDGLERLGERESLREEFTVELLGSEPFDFAVIYSEWVDDMAHLHWDFFADDEFLLTDLPKDGSVDEWERAVVDHRAEPAVAAYLRMDEYVGRLRARFEADFVVVSDHGWSFDGHLHYGSPDGVVILSGPSFRAGVDLRDVGTVDIAPTVLAAVGLPLSDDLAGDVLADAFARAPDANTVATYGAPVRATEGAPSGGAQRLERLRALGYVQ